MVAARDSVRRVGRPSSPTSPLFCSPRARPTWPRPAAVNLGMEGSSRLYRLNPAQLVSSLMPTYGPSARSVAFARQGASVPLFGV